MPRPLQPEQMLTPVSSDIEIIDAIAPLPITGDTVQLDQGQDRAGRARAPQRLTNGNYVVVTGITPTLLDCARHCVLTEVFACIRQSSQGPAFGVKGSAAVGGYSQVIPMVEFNLRLTETSTLSLLPTICWLQSLTLACSTRTHRATRRCFVGPTVKDGPRKFSRVMSKRLQKLGITKVSPNDLTDEEIHKFVRLDIDPDTITWRRVLDTCDRASGGRECWSRREEPDSQDWLRHRGG
ncbi:hypothetical protein PHYPSEUDO_012174 [Phytophthora pseudosyringae]|uniref:Uncharacterized protein n=1 Tax=Phytophthora pseudosyringae TaxID=221518 RepID=A0A8T1VA00_9STRA|nr:hypothetical protein PHYPSEUDO_012174 [Phytophthora pseudosyringae]